MENLGLINGKFLHFTHFMTLAAPPPTRLYQLIL